MFTKDELFNIIREKEVFRDAGTQFMVVDENLKVLYVNDLPVEEADRVCPGDLVKCQNALHGCHGCGSHDNCIQCSLRNTAKKALESNEKLVADGSLLLKGNNEFDYHAVVTPFEDEGKHYAVVLLMDRTEYNRELMMERIFFHDVLNLSGALNGILECIEHDNHEEMVEIVKGISAQLMDEINSQKDLIYAQKGILETKRELMLAREPILFAYESLMPLVSERHGMTLLIDSTLKDEQLESDKTLIHRVLHNMLKNACEASQKGDAITLRARASEKHITYSVHNSSVIPQNIRRRMFLHGNSTKGMGRGLGTYSIKLLGENYLGGKVWFTSDDGIGTDFYLQLDKVNG